MFCDADVTLTTGVARLTVTEALPEAPIYADELVESGVKEAFNVTPPAASDPGRITMVALPPLRAVVEEA